MLAAAAIIITKNFVDRKTEEYMQDINTNTQIPYKDYSDNDEYDEYNQSEEDDEDITDNEIDENRQVAKEDDESDTPYFIVKESNNIVKVFFNKNGREKYLQDTDIIFDTLSEEDQKRFCEGIIVNSEEELNKLIMDYES